METYKFSREEMIKILSDGGCESCPMEEACKKIDDGCPMEQQAAELLRCDRRLIEKQADAIAIILAQPAFEAESGAKPYKQKVFVDKACRKFTDKGIVTHPVSFPIVFVGEVPYTMEEFIMKRVPAGLPCDDYNRCFICDEVNILEEKPFHVTVEGVGDRFICPRCAHKYFKC